MSDQGRAGPPQGAVVGNSPAAPFSLPATERARRLLNREGVAHMVNVEAAEGDVVALRADWVLEARLVKALIARPGVVLASPEGDIVAAHAPAAVVRAALAGETEALPRVGAEDLAPAYDPVLRRRGAPLMMRLTESNLREVEARLFADSYKGVTDIVTRHVWPTPARIVVRWCAALGISPNTVTFVSFLLVLLTFWLFWTGQFGWGLVAGWAMTFLDTVDGKLARVTLTSSRWGDVFDHGIDLTHPPFWWWAWIVGLAAAGSVLPYAPWILAVVVGGYVVQRLVEGAFLKLHRMEVHSWRRFDSLFRQITARRNPNLILLTLGWAIGRPDWGLIAVAIWTGVSLIVHLIQLLQSILAPRPLTPWMARA